MTITTEQIITVQFEWEGIMIKACFDPQSYGSENFEVAHLQVKSVTPPKAPLPFTNTGYRSTYLSKEQIEVLGGVKAYVLEWLNHEAKSKKWQQHLKDTQQLSLF